MTLIPEQIAEYFSIYLDRGIHKALLRLVDVTVEPRVGQTGISLELFLCTLHLVYGRAVLRAFDDNRAFLRMQRELFPRAEVSRYRRLLQRFQLPSIFIRYDRPLRDLLWESIRIARASGNKRAGLREILVALCLNDALVENLKATRGISPLGFLPKLPDIAHQK
jgi:hypothetical protein